MIIVKSIDEIEAEGYKNFSCGDHDLDKYLQMFARQNHKKGIGKSFVALSNERVIGFYTISMSSIEFVDLLDAHKKGLPKYPIPVAKIGRLAVDMQVQGKKIGTALLIDALGKIKEASTIVAAYAVIVDAKNEKAKKFYESFGFVSYKNELSLYLPMKTVSKLVE